MPSDLIIPPLSDPRRYTGLYVIRFAHGTAVGYVAEEVAPLLAADAYPDAEIFRIHRVDDAGRIELVGVRVEDLAKQECMLFATGDSESAGGIFAELRRLAKDHPLPCFAQVELIDLPDFDLPHAVCLLYSQSASTMVAQWLLGANFTGGESVLGGSEAMRMRQSANDPIARIALTHEARYAPRSREEVLANVHEPVQR